jgi:DNA-binding MarR family transcriptional regulator
MTGEQRRVNDLLFRGLGGALFPDEEWESWDGFVNALAAREPTDFRHELVSRIGGEVRADVRVLLADPAVLQDMVVMHLRTMWGAYLAPEWERVDPVLESIIRVCRRQIGGATTPSDALHVLASDWTSEGAFALGGELGEGGEEMVFVLSPHMVKGVRSALTGRHRWIFFGMPAHPAMFRRAPVGEAELFHRLRTLGSEPCLHILALLTQSGEMSAQEIMSRMDLSQPAASRYLKGLSSSGFVMERRRGGAAKYYRATPGHLSLTVDALDRWLRGELEDEPSEEIRDPGLRRFLDAAGRVTTWPAKRRDQLVVLTYLVSDLESGRVFSEAEVNDLLTRRHTWNDPAYLRRALVDERLLQRTPDGAQYWVVDTDGETS